MSNAKYAIMKAKIEGVVTELMVKTNVDRVYMTENGQEITLASKLADIILAIDGKATPTDVTNAVAALKQELMGDLPKEAYDTFTELAAYIEEHEDAATALQEAIGNKADKTTVEAIQQTLAGLGALATKSTVSESDLDAALKEKLSNVDASKHTHTNKELLDTYTQTEENLADAVAKKHSHANAAELDKIAEGDKAKWDAAEAKAHEHGNKAVLDGITAEKVTAWDAAEQNAKGYTDGKVAGLARIFVQESEPANMTENDLFFQIVEE